MEATDAIRELTPWNDKEGDSIFTRIIFASDVGDGTIRFHSGSGDYFWVLFK